MSYFPSRCAGKGEARQGPAGVPGPWRGRPNRAASPAAATLALRSGLAALGGAGTASRREWRCGPSRTLGSAVPSSPDWAPRSPRPPRPAAPRSLPPGPGQPPSSSRVSHSPGRGPLLRGPPGRRRALCGETAQSGPATPGPSGSRGRRLRKSSRLGRGGERAGRGVLEAPARPIPERGGN